MLPLAKIPTIIEHYANYFSSVFSPEGFINFQRMLSGLLLGENKTIEAINRMFFVEIKHPNSLNHFMNHSPFDLDHLNECRMELLQDNPQTKIKSTGKSAGALMIDDTLLSHYGQKIDNIHKLFDHVSNSYVYAHNLVTLHYSDNQCDYPIDYELWLPMDVEKVEQKMIELEIRLNSTHQENKETHPAKWRRYLMNRFRTFQYKKPEIQQVYQTKLHIAQGLLKQFFTQHPNHELPVAFDSWYTQPEMCRFIAQDLKQAYVGQVKSDELLSLRGHQTKTIEQYAKELVERHQDIGDSFKFNKTTVPYKGQSEIYYTYCCNKTFKRFGKQRLVISFSSSEVEKANPRFFISNRLHWNASGICRISRHRWPVEVFHQEGKAEGLDQYQLRNFTAIQRHVALVVVIYSMLQRARYDQTLLPKLQYQLDNELFGSLAYWRRFMKANAFFSLVEWIYSFAQKEVKEEFDLKQILQPLMAKIAYS